MTGSGEFLELAAWGRRGEARLGGKKGGGGGDERVGPDVGAEMRSSQRLDGGDASTYKGTFMNHRSGRECQRLVRGSSEMCHVREERDD